MDKLETSQYKQLLKKTNVSTQCSQCFVCCNKCPGVFAPKFGRQTEYWVGLILASRSTCRLPVIREYITKKQAIYKKKSLKKRGGTC